MTPEWKRRTVAILIAFASVAVMRKLEPATGRIGIDPLWITRISALAILIACFRLTDEIPDSEWDRLGVRLSRPRFRARHGGILLAAIWLMLMLTEAAQ